MLAFFGKPNLRVFMLEQLAAHRAARAALIAFAPELLAALKELMAVYDRIGGPLAADPSAEKALAAIAKAERSPLPGDAS